jgi:two-component system cell cycle response regulator
MDTSSREVKILVADDSPIYRKLVEQSLSQENYVVLLAKSGRQAIDLFIEHKPALVITDWSMPDISGIELCQRIRRDHKEFYAYVILLTGNTDKEEVIEGLAAGADDYLTKPFHPGELQARVRVGRRIVDLHCEIQDKNRQLEEMALTDSLTGLPNRRAIDFWASRQLSAAVRHDFPVWVVMADLDHFKSINDTHGHDAGVEKQNAAIAIERIRQQCAAQKFTVANHTFGVTASFGIAGVRATMRPDFSDLVTRADAALYSAKRQGRNRIEFEIEKALSTTGGG